MNSIMKRIVVLFVAIIAIVACEKESQILTMDEAVKKVEKIIKKYPDRGWYASKNIIEPNTVLQYSKYGMIWDHSELMHEYVSPGYKAWLIVLGEEISSSSFESYDCLHLFVNASTGKYEQVWLDGRVILEWGSDPYSRSKK